MRVSRDEQRRYIYDRSAFLNNLPPLRQAAGARQAALQASNDLPDHLAAHLRIDEQDAVASQPEQQHTYLLRSLRAAATGTIPRRVWAGLDSDDEGALDQEDEIEDCDEPCNADNAAGDTVLADAQPFGRKRKRAHGGAGPDAEDFAAAAAQAARDYQELDAPGVSDPEQLRNADPEADAAELDAVDMPMPNDADMPAAHSPRSKGSPPQPDFDAADFDPALADLDYLEQQAPDDMLPEADLEGQHSFSAFNNTPQGEASQFEERQLHERTRATLARIQELAQVLICTAVCLAIHLCFCVPDCANLRVCGLHVLCSGQMGSLSCVHVECCCAH